MRWMNRNFNRRLTPCRCQRQHPSEALGFIQDGCLKPQHAHRLFKTAIALLTVALLLTPAPWGLAGGGMQSVAALDDKSEQLKSEINQAKEKLDQTRREIEEIKAQAADWKSRIAGLELENERAQAERETILQQVQEAQETLLLRQEEQAEAEKRVIEKQDQYQKRVSAMFYFKQRSPWEILLSANGLEGFFTNIRMITAITAADSSVLTELKHAEEIRQAATELAEKTHDAFQTFLEEKEAELADLEAGLDRARQEQSRLAELLTNRSLELENEARDVQAKEAAFQAYQAALAQYSGQIAKLTPAAHGAVWPLPASQMVTSPYGYRTLGFDKSNGFVHTGTDFGGPNIAGTPVVAAWEGIVLTVHQPYPGQMYAPDANYVQLSHGGGLGSGYWHLQSVAVVPGQHVAQGQVIGYCGSTGMSTGPHLHFEVYDQNSTGIRHTVDPMLYLAG